MKFKFVTVGYIPTEETTDLSSDEIYLFEGPLAAGFEQLLTGAAVIDPAIIEQGLNATTSKRSVWNDTNISESRAKMINQVGIKDPYAAEFLAFVYGCIEGADWKSLEDCLEPDVFWQVQNLEDFDLRTSETDGHYNRTMFLQCLTVWRNRFEWVKFDVKWANISSERAVVNFNMVGNGDYSEEVLTLYEFKRIGGKYTISAIANHAKTSPLMLTTPHPDQKPGAFILSNNP
ncbi:hypothetical protein [uncultured Mediterranean phage uvDeep-CGR2-KM23-C198]|nr:hypothetical protein [uncultured Mediterranean phage uvDeep-CGR2-KM23-C198]